MAHRFIALKTVFMSLFEIIKIKKIKREKTTFDLDEYEISVIAVV